MTGDMRFVQVWCCSRHYDGEPLFQPMIVCLCCGNKRCPKATDHRLPCTQSNDPGQPGSAWAGAMTTTGLGGEPLALRTADYIAALEQESETLQERAEKAIDETDHLKRHHAQCHPGPCIEVNDFAIRIQALESQNQALREALEFYADPETYLAIGFFPDPPCGEFMDDFGETGTAEYGPRPGERARKALGYG